MFGFELGKWYIHISIKLLYINQSVLNYSLHTVSLFDGGSISIGSEESADPPDFRAEE